MPRERERECVRFQEAAREGGREGEGRRGEVSFRQRRHRHGILRHLPDPPSCVVVVVGSMAWGGREQVVSRAGRVGWQKGQGSGRLPSPSSSCLTTLPPPKLEGV